MSSAAQPKFKRSKHPKWKGTPQPYGPKGNTPLPKKPFLISR